MNITKKWIFVLVVITFIIYNITAQAANSRYNNGSLPTRIVEVTNAQLVNTILNFTYSIQIQIKVTSLVLLQA